MIFVFVNSQMYRLTKKMKRYENDKKEVFYAKTLLWNDTYLKSKKNSYLSSAPFYRHYLSANQLATPKQDFR
jgi:hypothetical protein